MNDKFFQLPMEKQQRILNGGYRVFAQNSYKKSPVAEIAAEAGISKSLLFHYFRNKQELYLFLWENVANETTRVMQEFRCGEKKDLFELLEAGMQAKMSLMRRYPYMALFALRAFYEEDPQVAPAVQKSYQDYAEGKIAGLLTGINPEDFVPGLDLGMMYRDMYRASEGYMLEMMRQGPVDFDKLERDFMEMIQFWKQIYKRKGNNV